MPLKKKARFIFRLILTFLKKHYLTLLAGIIIGIVLFFLIPKALKYIPKTKKTIKIGLVGKFDINNIPEVVQKEISFGLTSIGSDGKPMPSIAKNWSVSDDGKVYLFHLNGDVLYWHDGEKLQPSDINYNFKDVQTSLEGNNLVFKLNKPYAPFPSAVSKPLFKKGLIGLGNYKVSKIIRAGNDIKSINLQPFKNQDLPKKIYKIYNNDENLKTAFNLGEIDFIDQVENLNGLYLGPNTIVNEYLADDIYVAAFLDSSNEKFSEKSFRQGLSYAIEKKAGEERAVGPLNSKSWAYNPDVKPYNLDIEKAKSLSKVSNNSNMEIKINTFPQYEEIANLLKEGWNKIGIKSEIEIIREIPPNFEVLIVGRKIPSDPDQYLYWHSTQKDNLSKLKSPRIDKLLEDGRITANEEDRKNISYDFQRFLVEESPAIFLIHPKFYRIQR